VSGIPDKPTHSAIRSATLPHTATPDATPPYVNTRVLRSANKQPSDIVEVSDPEAEEEDDNADLAVPSQQNKGNKRKNTCEGTEQAKSKSAIRTRE